MNIAEAKEIIKNEGLENYCLFCDTSPNEGQIVIKKEAGKWIVFTYNERTSKSGKKIYKNESDALEEFIKRLRGDKLVREYFGKSI